MTSVDDLSLEAIESIARDMRAALQQRGYQNTDSFETFKLIRFAKAKRLDVEVAAEMFDNCLKWRAENKVDEIEFDPEKGPFPIFTRGFECVIDQNPVTSDEGRLKFYRYGGGSCYHKHDKEFHPVYIERIGLTNSKLLVKHVSFNTLFCVKIQANEMMGKHIMPECSEKAGKNIDTLTVIMDCTGLGMQHFNLPALKLLGDLTQIDVKYYPERLNKIYWVNAPRIFTMFYDFGKTFFDERILSKVVIVSPEDTPSTLREIIDDEALPSFLGGKCTCGHMEGGCVPSQQLTQQEEVYETNVTVAAWADHQKEVTLQKSGIIKYKFKTLEYDIAFGAKFTNNERQVETLIEKKQVDSHEDKIEGVIIAKMPGVYTFIFDNSYSMFRSKELSYSFEIEETNEGGNS